MEGGGEEDGAVLEKAMVDDATGARECIQGIEID
jgi:hypothetical protein